MFDPQPYLATKTLVRPHPRGLGAQGPAAPCAAAQGEAAEKGPAHFARGEAEGRTGIIGCWLLGSTWPWVNTNGTILG